ncbi:elongation factor P hydroxylase [Halomonas sp. McH1-25]|uniref:elongation factor P hydroxylase n=1 Tax=unclassified Halomonas TaxID=2609666 RepID=UPI001EF5FF5C|nr:MULTISPECIES: elongation factor P hydroxylase [unclassified Halomonas]MCG7602037.1 elongation factor P hydroxylase [Halomonas sp. McH1-25]MCP1344436.1 elongation factor P hydroxylase [Halomonas sp. FL8]MCP1362282.1 elongation factor P hydroxylase [Halomonas sp. BBD45]MCP1365868.1 elongation factor P hydroxylase [Halomonas sp. BBD48]
MTTTYRLDDVIALFDGLFADTFSTRLVLGGDEPLYVPADEACPCHRVVFARGYFSSALHEISHWCIAGARRRKLEDYGYWYLPDGRNAEQQAAFETAEVAPQALEMLFSRACGRVFHVSVDNLGDIEVDRKAFRNRVEARAQRYEREGLPRRAEAFRTALSAYYRQGAGLPQAIDVGVRILTERMMC